MKSFLDFAEGLSANARLLNWYRGLARTWVVGSLIWIVSFFLFTTISIGPRVFLPADLDWTLSSKRWSFKSERRTFSQPLPKYDPDTVPEGFVPEETLPNYRFSKRRSFTVVDDIPKLRVQVWQKLLGPPFWVFRALVLGLIYWTLCSPLFSWVRKGFKT